MKRLSFLAVFVFLLVAAKGIVIKDTEIGMSALTIYPSFSGSFSSQYKENWCWAACVQMVLDYYGLYITQSDIVEKVYGYAGNFTADSSRIVNGINGWLIGGRRILAYKGSEISLVSLASPLKKGIPLIVGLREPYDSVNHTYVLTHIFSEEDSIGSYNPVRVRLVNPAKKGDLEEDMDWVEFKKRIAAIITIKVD